MFDGDLLFAVGFDDALIHALPALQDGFSVGRETDPEHDLVTYIDRTKVEVLGAGCVDFADTDERKDHKRYESSTHERSSFGWTFLSILTPKNSTPHRIGIKKRDGGLEPGPEDRLRSVKSYRSAVARFPIM